MAGINNRPDNPGAFIIDGHGLGDLGVVRALGEKGVPVYLATDDKTTEVSHSRFVKQVFVFPPPGAADDRKVEALIAIAERFRYKPVLFSTGDTSLLLISRNLAILEKYYRHHIGDSELLEALNDKQKFALFAKGKGLPVPHSLVPNNIEHLKKGVSKLEFPVMVKPAEKKNWAKHKEIWRIAKGNLKGLRIETADALIRLYEELTPYDNRIVIQEYIEGRDEAIWSLHIYIDRKSEVKGWYTAQKIRTYPIHRGIGCFVVSAKNRRVYESGSMALKTIGYTGHAIVQVKQIPDSEDSHIFEINTRYASSSYQYTKAGVNLAYLAYQDSLGFGTEPLPEQREGTCWIDAANDIKAFRDYRRIGEWTLWTWLRSYIKQVHFVSENSYAVFAWNDPAPWLFTRFKRIRHAGGRVVRSILRLSTSLSDDERKLEEFRMLATEKEMSRDERQSAVMQFFSENAESWQEMYSGDHSDPYNIILYQARSRVALSLLDGLNRNGGSWLLDLGCGPGVQAELAAILGWKVVAADVSVGMLNQAAKKFNQPRWVAGRVEDLPFRPHSFDAVFMLGLIGYLPNPAQGLQVVRKCLHSGGHLIISWKGRRIILNEISRTVSALPRWLYRRLKAFITGRPVPVSRGVPKKSFYDRYCEFWTEREFCDLLEGEGFKVVALRGVNFGRFRFMGKTLWPKSVDIYLSHFLERLSGYRLFAWLTRWSQNHIALVTPDSSRANF